MALWRFFVATCGVSCRSCAPACLIINFHDQNTVNAERRASHGFTAISKLGVSPLQLWSRVESAKVTSGKQISSHCKTWDVKPRGPEMLSEKNQGKMHYFPSSTSVVLEKTIFYHIRIVHWKTGIEFQIIYWEIMTFEVIWCLLLLSSGCGASLKSMLFILGNGCLNMPLFNFWSMNHFEKVLKWFKVKDRTRLLSYASIF